MLGLRGGYQTCDASLWIRGRSCNQGSGQKSKRSHNQSIHNSTQDIFLVSQRCSMQLQAVDIYKIIPQNDIKLMIIVFVLSVGICQAVSLSPLRSVIVLQSSVIVIVTYRAHSNVSLKVAGLWGSGRNIQMIRLNINIYSLQIQISSEMDVCVSVWCGVASMQCVCEQRPCGLNICSTEPLPGSDVTPPTSTLHTSSLIIATQLLICS